MFQKFIKQIFFLKYMTNIFLKYMLHFTLNFSLFNICTAGSDCMEDLDEVEFLEMKVDTRDTSLGNFGVHLPNLAHLKLSNSIITSIRYKILTNYFLEIHPYRFFQTFRRVLSFNLDFFVACVLSTSRKICMF